MTNPLTPILEEAEQKCKTSPHCSHNTNGRSMDKPCSITFPEKEIESYNLTAKECDPDMVVMPVKDAQTLIKSTATSILNTAIEEIGKNEENATTKDGIDVLKAGINKGITTSQATLRAMRDKINE